MKVQLGDVVLYREESNREDYPAIISRLRQDGTADLHVFRPGLNVMPVTACPRDAQAKPETWRTRSAEEPTLDMVPEQLRGMEEG